MTSSNVTYPGYCEIFSKNYLELNSVSEVYTSQLPNFKEYLNNAMWRISLDAIVEHFIPGLGNQPFYKEIVYNVAGVPSALSSAYFGLSIGQGKKTYGPWHATYAVTRAIGKLTYISYAVWLEPSKFNTRNALQFDSARANYLVDTTIRWMPFQAEQIQLNPHNDVYSFQCYVITMVGGYARTFGAETGGKIVRFLEYFTVSNSILTLSAGFKKIQDYLPFANSIIEPVQQSLSFTGIP